jgi:hypothetical protein
MQEVSGSIPLGSTNLFEIIPTITESSTWGCIPSINAGRSRLIPTSPHVTVLSLATRTRKEYCLRLRLVEGPS